MSETQKEVAGEQSTSSFPVPVRETKVKCSCGAEQLLSETVSERNFPELPNVREGILTCLNCGNIYHSYFISPETINLRDKLQATAVVFQKRQIPKNFRALQQIREIYRESFDADQVRYKEMLEKVVTQDGREP